MGFVDFCFFVSFSSKTYSVMHGGRFLHIGCFLVILYITLWDHKFHLDSHHAFALLIYSFSIKSLEPAQHMNE